MNLYAFVDNDGLNYVDILGLYAGVKGHGGPISPKDSVTEIQKLQDAADAQGEASTARRLKGILPLFGNPDEFNTNDKNHFVYTCKYGWVDMGHFFRNANGVKKLGTPVTFTGAVLLEVVQFTIGRAPELLKRTRLRTSKSGFAVEDLESNALGRQFGRDIKKQSKGAAVDIFN